MTRKKVELPKVKEDIIELSILQWIEYRLRIKAVWKNDIKGFYSAAAKTYFKNTNPYVRKGISDISFLKNGKFVCIEVKKPSEMTFFTQPMEDLKRKFIEAKMLRKTTAKRLEHAIEQQKFIEQINNEGGIAFFADSVDNVQKKLLAAGLQI